MASNHQIVADGRNFTLTTPIPREHLSTTIWEWFQTFWNQMVNDPMPQTRDGIAAWMERCAAKGGKSYFAVDEKGEPVGTIWGEAGDDNIHIAHLVFARHRVSREVKLVIAKAAIRQYFADGARKLIWGIYADNEPAIAFLKQLGASVEGTLKKQTRRDGQLMDVVLMAIFPEDLQ